MRQSHFKASPPLSGSLPNRGGYHRDLSFRFTTTTRLAYEVLSLFTARPLWWFMERLERRSYRWGAQFKLLTAVKQHKGDGECEI